MMDRRERETLPVDGPPPPRRANRMLPWWRRLGAWLSDFHRFVLTLVAVGGSTVAGHAWVRGLITEPELKKAVEDAVRSAMVDVRTDLEVQKQRTSGIAEWRGDVTVRLATVEVVAGEAKKKADKNDERIDRFAFARGLH